jgi:hypothetical protein
VSLATRKVKWRWVSKTCPRPHASHLDPDNYDLWLDPGMRDVAAASELLKPYDARLMRCYPVSTRINRVANDDEECSTTVELAEIQNHLFL